MDFLIVNGKVVSKSEAKLTEFVWDEPFILSQRVWFGFGGIPLFNENIQLLERQLATFNLTPPKLIKNKRELFRLVKRMLNKNKFYRSGYVNFQLYISNKNIHTLITSHAFPEFDFPISAQGLLVYFSKVVKNSRSNLGIYKCHNSNLWKAAKAEALKLQWNGSILLNEKGLVCEGIASNLFLVKDGVLVTPSLETGCYHDLLRPIILKLAKHLNLKIIEVPEIEKEHLFEMDELFFASEEHGIQWILGIENKRYVHEISQKIYNELNNYLKEKVTV